MAQVHGGRAKGRGHPCLARHDDARNIHGVGDEAGRHGARAAEARQDEITRVTATGDDNFLHRLRHALAADADHAVGGLYRRQTEFFGQALDGGFGAGAVELHLAAERGLDTAEQQIGIGDGGSLPPRP